MIPLLYESTQKTLSPATMKCIGMLSCCTACTVKEEINGDYTLSATVSALDPCAQKLSYQQFIKAKPNFTDEPQYFEIYRLVYKDFKTIEIEAKHIKHCCYNNYVTSPESSDGYGTPTEIWDECANGSFIFENYFNFHSDITDKAYVSNGYTAVSTVGEFLGGTNGSLLSAFGGEFYYDNFDIWLKKQRGEKSNYTLQWGENISSLSQTLTSEDIVSHVYAYVTIHDEATDTDIKITDNGGPYEIANNNCKVNKILLVDASDNPGLEGITVNSSTGLNYDWVKAICRLVQSQYFHNSDTMLRGTAKVNITVDMHAELEEMSILKLGDTIKVKLNTEETVTAEIISTEFNALLERWNSIEVGDAKSKLSDLIF